MAKQHLPGTMTQLFSRYQCPRCGAGLSRTGLYPRAEVYELQFPSYRVPVLRICVVIAVAGFALAFIHIALSMVSVLAVAAWAGWRYYGALQCDGCKAYYISGQFAGGQAQVLPWRRADTLVIVRRASVMLLIGLAVFLPIHFLQRTFESRCAADCGTQGLAGDAEFHRLSCRCVPATR